MTGNEIFNKVICLVESRNSPNNDWDSKWEELMAIIRPINFREMNLLLNKLVEQKELMGDLELSNPIASCIGLIAEGLSKKFLEAVKDIESQKGFTSEAHKDVARLIKELSGFGLFLLGETKVGEQADSALTYHAAGVIYYKLATPD